MSTRNHKTCTVFQKFHSEECLRKAVFLVTVFTNTKVAFLKENGYARARVCVCVEGGGGGLIKINA